MRGSLSAAALLIAAVSSVHATCYRRTADSVRAQTSSWVACNNTATHSGGAELCCLSGSECGQDSICRSDSTKTGQSRWYVGACTDANYNDPVCRRDCTQYKQTFITYDSTQWQCCGNSGCDESPNANEKFSAVSPSQWSAKGGTSKNSDAGSNIDIGEEIGLGVAGVVAIVVIIAAGMYCLRRSVKRSRQGANGVRGRYEELGRQLSAPPAAPVVPYGARDTSPQPYGRSTSPIPPVRRMDHQRDRSRSIALEERTPLPDSMRLGYGQGPVAPDQLSMLSRGDHM